MAGIQDRAEGLVALRVSTIAGANPLDSLEGLEVNALPQGSTAWVSGANEDYRWNDLSTFIPDGSSVVQPLAGPGRWLRELSGAATFDHVITSRSDLENVVAPVSGEFILPSGSYAITGDVVLDTGETVSVKSGAQVLIWGTFPNGKLTSDGSGGATLTVSDGDLYVYNLTISATGNDESALVLDNAASVVKLWGATLLGDPAGATNAAGAIVSDGRLWASNSLFDGKRFGVNQAAGEVYLVLCDLSGEVTAFSQADGESLLNVCRLIAKVSGNGVECTSTAFTHVVNCSVKGGSDTAVQVNSSANVSILGGMLDGNSTEEGVRAVTNGSKISVTGVTFRNCDSCVLASSGQAESLVVSGQADSTCTNGINSATTEVPTDGLIVKSFAFAGSGSFLTGGILTTSARVNVKASLNAAGLQTETAIVP